MQSIKVFTPTSIETGDSTIIEGDARWALARLPDESVQCVVTSPPYWGLRDYRIDGQIGLEADLGRIYPRTDGGFCRSEARSKIGWRYVAKHWGWLHQRQPRMEGAR